MPKSTPLIRLRGVRHNNLKNFDIDLPTGRLIVITGLSGSGKSSLAFDTLYAEGQRRYVETFSPYARQFFDRMDKPQVDKIEGIPPAIAIEQRNTVKTTRSTVGTITEICDYMKVIWSHLARLHCRQCGQAVHKDSPQQIWETLACPAPHPEALITFELPLSEKLSLTDSLALIVKQGYQRLLLPARSDGGSDDWILREAIQPFGSTAATRVPGGEIVRIEEAPERLQNSRPAALTVIQDRVKLAEENRARFVEACEQAYHFGKGRLAIHPVLALSDRPSSAAFSTAQNFSRRLHCASCDIEYRDPSPALFSFNHPVGACPTCRGFGRTITIDYNLAIPDRSLTLAGGAVKPWQTGTGAESQADLAKFCRHSGIPMNVPFRDLKPEWQEWVINGDADYGVDDEHQWPRAWYGVKGYFRWLESKAYKMHVRVLLSRYRAYRTCPDCQGNRLKPEALLYRLTVGTSAEFEEIPLPDAPAVSVAEMGKRRKAAGEQASRDRGEKEGARAFTLAEFYRLSVQQALQCVDTLVTKRGRRAANDPLTLVLGEVRSRLGYLEEVGLGYLTLDRPTRTLSGGETERVSLTTALGSRLVNTLFVLDEPSVGLHARDTERLVRILQRLRDAGNTVVVVEHEAALMRAADQIVDLGPGHGESGGSLVFQGPFQDILKARASITGEYLSDRKRVEHPPRRAIGATPELILTHATQHNLKDLTVRIPLGRLVCVTGVSGSGKTTLVREVLMPLLGARLENPDVRPSTPPSPTEDNAGGDDLERPEAAAAGAAGLQGWESLGRVVLVDQSPLGRTPRSNPAVYMGAFEDIRDLFAQSEVAKQRGLNASAFSFNSGQGQCQTCRGAGFEKIEMQFLSDVFIRCPDCQGRRYREHILEVKLRGPVRRKAPGVEARPRRPARFKPAARGGTAPSHADAASTADWNIADLLDAPVDEAIGFLTAHGDSRAGQRALRSLGLLQEVGLGYLRLGQPINTLSGGESQRLKLVSHLAEFQHAEAAGQKPTLFLFDEPTTGLHFDDVRVLLQVIQRLVESGHSVLIIEHNLDVIRCADWIVDLGPEAGEKGGQLVVAGTPEQVAACPRSHTGRALSAIVR